MANYSARKVKHLIAVAGEVDTVELTHPTAFIEVINRGQGDIYCRTDGRNPILGGDDCEIIPMGASFLMPAPGHTTIVRLISDQGGAYTVAVR